MVKKKRKQVVSREFFNKTKNRREYIMLYMDKETKKRIKDYARENNVSMSCLFVSAIEDQVLRKDNPNIRKIIVRARVLYKLARDLQIDYRTSSRNRRVRVYVDNLKRLEGYKLVNPYREFLKEEKKITESILDSIRDYTLQEEDILWIFRHLAKKYVTELLKNTKKDYDEEKIMEQNNGNNDTCL